MVKPATGTCVWLTPALNGNPRLEINVQNATGELISHIYEVARAADGGYDLLRVKDGEIVCYTVRSRGRGLWECNCPDAQKRAARRYTCKHARALPAALRKLPF
jgi:hypothetical protein